MQMVAGISHNWEMSALTVQYPPLGQVRAKAGYAKKPRSCSIAEVEPHARVQLAGPRHSAPFQHMYSLAWCSQQQAGHRRG